MSGIVGESFTDYGNAPECIIDRIPAYEVLDSGLIRIFVCKTFGGKLVLDHTDVMTRGMLVKIGSRMIEIAEMAPTVPEMALWIEGSKAH